MSNRIDLDDENYSLNRPRQKMQRIRKYKL